MKLCQKEEKKSRVFVDGRNAVRERAVFYRSGVPYYVFFGLLT